MSDIVESENFLMSEDIVRADLREGVLLLRSEISIAEQQCIVLDTKDNRYVQYSYWWKVKWTHLVEQPLDLLELLR